MTVSKNLTVFLASVVAVTCVSMSAGRASASTFRVPSIEKTTALSSVVVTGFVVSKSYRTVENANGDGAGRIVTDYEIAVSDVLAGCPEDPEGRTVRFTMPGGLSADIGQVVTGVPVYEPGDEVLLFLKRPANMSGSGDRAFYVVTGMAVGAFRILRESGSATVSGYVNGSNSRQIRSSDRSSPDMMDLDSFVGRIRAAADGMAGL